MLVVGLVGFVIQQVRELLALFREVNGVAVLESEYQLLRVDIAVAERDVLVWRRGRGCLCGGRWFGGAGSSTFRERKPTAVESLSLVAAPFQAGS